MAYENFTTYTEVDEGSDITVTATKVAWDNLENDETSYVYKDFSVGNFGNFSHDIELQLTSSSADSKVCGWVLSNHIAEYDEHYDNSWEALMIVMVSPGGNYRFYLRNNGNSVQNYVSVSANTLYYCTVTRASNTIYLYVYDDSDRTNLIGSTSIGCTVETFRYLYACMSTDEGWAFETNIGFSQNFDGVSLPTEITFEPTDTFTLTDNVIVKHKYTFSDDLEIDDNLTTILTHLIDISDTVNINETPIFKHDIHLEDAIAIPDSIVLKHEYALFDTLEIDDTLFQNDLYILENVDISDSLQYSSYTVDLFKINLSETLTINDTISLTWGIELADAVTISESVVFTHGFNPTDNVTIMDSVLFKHEINLVDSIKLNDSALFLLYDEDAFLHLNNSVSIMDVVLFKHIMTFSESISISDSMVFKRLIYLQDIVNIYDSLMYNIVFKLDSDSYSINLPMPSYGGESGSINNNLILFTFWAEDRDVSNMGIGSEPITLNGTIYASSDDIESEMEAIATKFLNIHTLMDDHESVSITGLGNCVDATYIIQNFSYSTIKGSPYAYTWQLTLEYKGE